MLGSDFAIWLAADTAREAKFTDRHVEWAVFRYLCRIGTDDNGNFISVPPDFEAFAAEIRIYGAPIENLRVARQAFQAGEQMGLFDVDAEQVEDDGAGVLIHDDGTPMSAEEVAELEESEVGDNGDDVLADPDADYDGDPLADVDL